MNPARIARLAAWVALAAGVALAAVAWTNVREVVTTTERIVGHATLTFEGVEVRTNWFLALMGGASLVGGGLLWALFRVLASIAEDLRRLRPD